MSFSILMSLYHKEHPEYLRQSLESILNQTLFPDEIILVEDGLLSNELYAVLNEYAARYPQFKRVSLPINGGLGRALNEGLKHCSCELVARMDTDDICFPDRFEKQVKFMTEHPEIDICSSWIEEFEDNIENSISIKKVPATHIEISEYIKSRNPLNHPAVMFRKSAVEKAGGYQHYPLFEDYYLWVRMFLSGAKFANIQQPLIHFRLSPDMFRRRGGWNYALNAVKFQWMLYESGLIDLFSALISSIIRGTVYLLPNTIRAIVYSKFLRTS